jgi:hypothetical protein
MDPSGLTAGYSWVRDGGITGGLDFMAMSIVASIRGTGIVVAFRIAERDIESLPIIGIIFTDRTMPILAGTITDVRVAATVAVIVVMVAETMVTTRKLNG